MSSKENLAGKVFRIVHPGEEFNSKFKHRLEGLGLHAGARVKVEIDVGGKLILKCNGSRIGIDKESVMPFLKRCKVDSLDE